MENYAIIKERRIKGKRHYQVPSGGIYPSVTTVLSIIPNSKLTEWIKAVGEQVATYVRVQGARRGEEFHSIVEDYLKLQSLDKYRRVLPKALFFQAKDTIDKITNIRLQEEILWSDELKIAGRVDCIADFDGVPSVIDFKTASKPKDESDIQNYFQQATAYSLMYEERAHAIIRQIVILVSCESGDVQVYVKNRDDFVSDLKHTIDQYYVQMEITNDIPLG